jgi:hypothetical protein
VHVLLRQALQGRPRHEQPCHTTSFICLVVASFSSSRVAHTPLPLIISLINRLHSTMWIQRSYGCFMLRQTSRTTRCPCGEHNILHKCARAPTTFHIATTHTHRPAHMSLSSSVSALAIATSSTCFSSSYRRRCCCRHRILFAFFSFTLLPLLFLVELDGHTDALRCTEGEGRQWLTVCRLVKRFLTRPPHRTHARTHARTLACLLFHLRLCRDYASSPYFRVLFRLDGGKGGFGSMLRAMGAKKSEHSTDNIESCRT